MQKPARAGFAIAARSRLRLYFLVASFAGSEGAVEGAGDEGAASVFGASFEASEGAGAGAGAGAAAFGAGAGVGLGSSLLQPAAVRAASAATAIKRFICFFPLYRVELMPDLGRGRLTARLARHFSLPKRSIPEKKLNGS